MKTTTKVKTSPESVTETDKEARRDDKRIRGRGIIPCLWFDNQAEEVAEFYVSIFENSQITGVSRYGEAGAKASGRPEGSAMVVTFQLDGQDFMALNGGPVFTFSPAVSFVVNCDTQEEVDRFWEKLSEAGEPGQCGWLTDKYGVSWQIVPRALGEMMKGGDARKSERLMKALLQMKRIDIKGLREAYGQH